MSSKTKQCRICDKSLTDNETLYCDSCFNKSDFNDKVDEVREKETEAYGIENPMFNQDDNPNDDQ